MSRTAKEPKEKMVTRTVTESMEVKVYAFTKGQTELKATITVTELPKKTEQKELAKKYGCDSVILEVVKENNVTYECPVSVYMANAKRVEPKAETATDVTGTPVNA
jgi:hypothetical protein